MSKYDDKWLDICLLLRELQSNGKVLIVPSNNQGNVKKLRFKLMTQELSEESSQMVLEVLQLADGFKFFVNNNKLEVLVFVNVFNT